MDCGKASYTNEMIPADCSEPTMFTRAVHILADGWELKR